LVGVGGGRGIKKGEHTRFVASAIQIKKFSILFIPLRINNRESGPKNDHCGTPQDVVFAYLE